MVRNTNSLLTRIALSFGLALALAPQFASAQAGALDTTFGSGGIVNTNFGPNNNNFTYADAALEPNGDIVVAGQVSFINGSQQAAAVIRYTPNGALDPTFGTNGVLILTFNNFVSSIQGISVQPNGQIVALVFTVNNATSIVTTFLIRFQANGSFDTTFGSGGQVAVNFPAPSPYAASPGLVIAQPGGKILLAGSATPPFRSKLPAMTAFGRYLTNGSVDTSFGTAGFAEEVAIGEPVALALLSTDGILAVNATGNLAQFSPNGALLPAPTGGTISAFKNTSIAFQANGEYLLPRNLIGTEGKTNLVAELTRFELNGGDDSSFQQPVIRFGPDAVEAKSIVQALNVDSTGRIIVGGIFETLSTEAFGLARLNSNGSLDTTFGSGGTLNTPIDLGGQVMGLLVQPNNEIIAIGEVFISKDTDNTMVDLVVARYKAQ